MDRLEKIYFGTAVCLLGTTLCGLLLAEFGIFNAYATILFGFAGLAVFLRLSRKTANPSPQNKWASFFLAGFLIYCLLVYLPPFNMVLGGVDPGVYFNTATQIEASGSILIRDPAVVDAARIPELSSVFLPWQGQYLPGFYLQNDTIIPQFYHAYPVLLAVFGSLFGFQAALYVTPLLGFLNGAGLFLLIRRWRRESLTPTLAVVLLAFNVSFVWFSRYVNSEILTLQFFTLGLFALLLAEDQAASKAGPGWALLSAASFGAALLTRIDTVFLLPAALLGWLVFAWRRQIRLAVAWSLALGTFIIWTLIHGYFFSHPYFYFIFDSTGIWPFIRDHKAVCTILVSGVSLAALVFTYIARPGCSVRNKLEDWTQRSRKLIFPTFLILILWFVAAYFILHWKILSWMEMYMGIPVLFFAVFCLLKGAREYPEMPPMRVSLMVLLLTGLVTILLLGPEPQVDRMHFFASRRLLVFVFPFVSLLAAVTLAKIFKYAGKTVGSLIVLVSIIPGIQYIPPLLHYRAYDHADTDIKVLADAVPENSIILCGPTGAEKTTTTFRFLFQKSALAFARDELDRTTLDVLHKTFPGRDFFLAMVAPEYPIIRPPYRLEEKPIVSVPIRWPEYDEPRDRLPKKYHSIGGSLQLWKILETGGETFIEMQAPDLEAAGVKVQGLNQPIPGETGRKTDGRALLHIPKLMVQKCRVLFLVLGDDGPQPAVTQVYMNGRLLRDVQPVRAQPKAFTFELPAGWPGDSENVTLEIRTLSRSPDEAPENQGVLLYKVIFKDSL